MAKANKNNNTYDWNKDKKALLISNGSIKDYGALSRIIEKQYGNLPDFFVIAADGGAVNSINLRLTPDVIIGDMDSITAKVIEKLNIQSKDIKFINCRPDKDESDTQLALDYLMGSGFRKVLILGALGNRPDHSYANIVLLAAPNYKDLDVRIITENSEISVARKSCKICGIPGRAISLFSLAPYTHIIKTSGLKYRLKNEKLLFSPVRGLSNEFIKDTAGIEFEEGLILVVKEL